MYLHKYFSQLQKTTLTATRIFESFETQGVNSVINAPPQTVQRRGQSVIEFVNILQCEQDSWRVSINVSHFPDLSESEITVNLHYTPLSFAHNRKTSELRICLRPYAESNQSATIDCEHPDQLANAFNDLHYTPRKLTTESMQSGFDESIFWEIVDRIVLATAKRNRSTSGKRRSRALTRTALSSFA